MNVKPAMLSTLLSAWMFAAVVCAALPITHAIAALDTLGGFAAFFAALIAGLAVGVPLWIAARRLCGLGAPDKDAWAALSSGTAARLGVISWGLPVGLLVTLEQFLQHKNMALLIPNVVVWPIAGIAFGLLMRRLAARRRHHSAG